MIFFIFIIFFYNFLDINVIKLDINYKILNNSKSDNSLVVRIFAFQASDPGSSPGCRNVFNFLNFFK